MKYLKDKRNWTLDIKHWTFRKGFTMIELLVVIAIIGILVAVGVASFSGMQKSSRESRRRQDIMSIQTAFEAYYSENNKYPVNAGIQAGLFAQGELPKDPKFTGANNYNRNVKSDGSIYCVCALLENNGTGNATVVGIDGICTFGTGDYYCLKNLQ